MTKKNRTSQMAVASLILVLVLSACGSGSTAAIADQANTSASIAAEDMSTDQFNVAMTTFAASFAASTETHLVRPFKATAGHNPAIGKMNGASNV